MVWKSEMGCANEIWWMLCEMVSLKRVVNWGVSVCNFTTPKQFQEKQSVAPATRKRSRNTKCRACHATAPGPQRRPNAGRHFRASQNAARATLQQHQEQHLCEEANSWKAKGGVSGVRPEDAGAAPFLVRGRRRPSRRPSGWPSVAANTTLETILTREMPRSLAPRQQLILHNSPHSIHRTELMSHNSPRAIYLPPRKSPNWIHSIHFTQLNSLRSGLTCSTPLLELTCARCFSA